MITKELEQELIGHENVVDDRVPLVEEIYKHQQMIATYFNNALFEVGLGLQDAIISYYSPHYVSISDPENDKVWTIRISLFDEDGQALRLPSAWMSDQPMYFLDDGEASEMYEPLLLGIVADMVRIRTFNKLCCGGRSPRSRSRGAYNHPTESKVQ
jgi:hypothetical protein